MIQDFKGKTYVNIREYFDSNGELRPGKKVGAIHHTHDRPARDSRDSLTIGIQGIMLTLEQYNALLGAIPDVNAELQSKGHQVPETSTDAAPSSSVPKPASTKSPSKEQKRKKKKMNIEATSDEDESD